VPYAFSAASYVIIETKNNNVRDGKLWFKMITAILAFAFSMWAIIGCGEEIVYWGFILLMAGTPFFVWMKKSAR
jgi:APA family basic amino acid/polyamine antiporter